MSVRKFKFVSPGVFVGETDNSQIPRQTDAVGPAIIAVTERGPGLRPVTIQSFSEFVEIFGNPIGGGVGGDLWREGNKASPSYGTYAIQAFLRNSAPVTVVRVLGIADPNATSGGSAGWKTALNHGGASASKPTNSGGAFGLWLFSSGSKQTFDHGAFLGSPGDSQDARAAGTPTGSLAAVWYFDKGAIQLSGTLTPGNNITASVGEGNPNGGNLEGAPRGKIAANGVAIRPSIAKKYEFTAVLYDNGNKPQKLTFNFDRDSDKYIRKVFNTNPTLLGEAVQTATKKGYFLGETFDRHVKDLHGASLEAGSDTGDASLAGVIVGLNGGGNDWALNQKSEQPSYSPWIIGQDVTTNRLGFNAIDQQKLFRLIALNDGEWSSKYIKLTISNHKAPSQTNPYGSFDLILRDTRDNDGARKVYETFGNLNLNPASRNYIGRRIGTQYQEWDNTENRYRTYGDYENNSRFVRVLMDSDVDQGSTDTSLLPWGFASPPRFKTIKFTDVEKGADKNSVLSGSNIHLSVVTGGVGNDGDLGELNIPEASSPTGSFLLSLNGIMAIGSSSAPFNSTTAFNCFSTSSMSIVGLGDPASNATPVAVFPTFTLRSGSDDDGIGDQRRACFGITTGRSPSSTRFDESYFDLVRGSQGAGANVYDVGDATEHAFVFTLDDVICTPTGSTASSVTSAHYQSGSRRSGTSYTALRNSYTDLIDSGFTSFTAPMYGGYDGIDIKQKAPFGDVNIGASFVSSYAAHSLKRAVDSVRDPEAVEINLLSAPGTRKPLITDLIVDTCEDRADALAVIDLENGGYQPTEDNTSDFKTRVSNASVQACVQSLRSRSMNSSYACSFFPWVKIFDEVNSKQVWVPPSVAAIGTFASSESDSELWFAPAGFTRGGLSEGSAGLPVIGVSQRLTAKDRDKLYDVNINPIATFPAEGIVIFGQKTMQATPSALDRINVRRLMIFVKKEISRIAARLLFDQNVQSTWNKFRGQVEPFLDSVRARLGLTDYRVVLDETTTTPELIDRNVMYAKIFLKPARAIEFIAIDFTITNSGASFDD
jgi:hypothetical protein